jgi:VanZ family protein
MLFLKRYWKSIAWAVVIFIVCTMPSDGVPRFKLFRIDHFDKFVHFSLYLILGVLLFLESRSQEENENLTLNTVIVVGSISIGYGILIELTQLFFTTTRSAELLDVLANTLGFIISVIAYYVVLRVLTLFHLK